MSYIYEELSENQLDSFKTQAKWFAVGLATATSQPQLRTQIAQETFAKVLGFFSCKDLRKVIKQHDEQPNRFSNSIPMNFPSWNVLKHKDIFIPRLTKITHTTEQEAQRVFKFLNDLGEFMWEENWKEATYQCFQNTKDISHLHIAHKNMYCDLIALALRHLNRSTSKPALDRMVSIIHLTHYLKVQGAISKVSLQLIWSALQPINYQLLREMAIDGELHQLAGFPQDRFFYDEAARRLDEDMSGTPDSQYADDEWRPIFERLLGNKFYRLKSGLSYGSGLTFDDGGFYQNKTKESEKRFINGTVLAFEKGLPEDLSHLLIEDKKLEGLCSPDLIYNSENPISIDEVNNYKFFYPNPKYSKRFKNLEKILKLFANKDSPKYIWEKSKFHTINK